MSTQNLETVVHCPDCGGVVGATSTSEHGAPCRCFDDMPKKKPVVAPIEMAPVGNGSGESGRVDSNRAASARADIRRAEPNLEDAGISSSTHGADDDSAGTAATESPAPQTEKLCIGCGKNVAGHRRVKDSRGYMCLACARSEDAGKKIQGAECQKCHRVVKEESITVHDGERICQRCLREARELTKPGSKRYRKIDDQHFEKAGKTQIIVLAVAAAVLALLMVIGWLSK